MLREARTRERMGISLRALSGFVIKRISNIERGKLNVEIFVKIKIRGICWFTGLLCLVNPSQ